MTPSEHIDTKIAGLNDWRGDLCKELRAIINAAVPDIEEGWKWDTAVWSKDGMVCALGAFKDHVKVNFFKGASLPDPHGLINNGFESKGHRAVDFKQGDKVNKPELTELIRSAANYNAPLT